MERPQRSPIRTTLGGAVLAGAIALGGGLLGGPPAGAAPAPAPTPAKPAPHLPLHVALGGLDISLDVPLTVGGLLGAGGGGSTSPTTAPKAAAAPTSHPTSHPAPTAASRRSTAPTSERTTVAPRRAPQAIHHPTAERSTQHHSTAAPLPARSADVATGGQVRSHPAGTARRSSAPSRPITRSSARVGQDAVQAFERVATPGLPPWLLLVVVGGCGLGTAAVVRLGGRRDRAQAAHHG